MEGNASTGLSVDGIWLTRPVYFDSELAAGVGLDDSPADFAVLLLLDSLSELLTSLEGDSPPSAGSGFRESVTYQPDPLKTIPTG